MALATNVATGMRQTVEFNISCCDLIKLLITCEEFIRFIRYSFLIWIDMNIVRISANLCQMINDCFVFQKRKKQPILFFVFRPYSNLLFTGAICDLVPVLKTFFRVGRLWHTVDMVQRRLDIRRSPTVMVNLLFENKE